MSYEVVLEDKHYLRELIESVSLTDSLDQISYEARIKLRVPPSGLAIAPGQTIRVSGVPHGGKEMVYLLNPGVVWECISSNRGSKSLSLVVYDRTIYLAKSEDEYLFSSGGTASQRLKKYAQDWQIKLASIPDTGKALSKATYRSQAIYNMIVTDLRETVKLGGEAYMPRMTPTGLELFKIGSNKTVWKLEALEGIDQHRTLEGTVTKVKVIGSTDSSKPSNSRTSNDKNKADPPSQFLAVETGEVSKFGTLQRIVQDEDVKTPADAKKLAKSMLTGLQETFTVNGLDINTLRAGDKVELNGMELIVMSISHELGEPGRMSLELGSYDYVKRRYYLNHG